MSTERNIGAATSMIGKDELKQFPTILKNVSETNLFPIVLDEDQYRCIAPGKYQKGEDHLIEVFHKDGKWQYENLKHPADRGTLVDFIANRLRTDGIEISRKPADVFQAAKIAKLYYSEHIKNLKRAYQIAQAPKAKSQGLRR